MKVVLKERVSGLGMPGDIVEVKDGYAVNNLIPNNKAVLGTKDNLQQAKKRKEEINKKKKQLSGDAYDLFSKLEGLNVIFEVENTRGSKLKNQIKNQEIKEAALKELNTSEMETEVTLKLPMNYRIKYVGKHTIQYEVILKGGYELDNALKGEFILDVRKK
jgi:large subunit ribosomal protein L9